MLEINKIRDEFKNILKALEKRGISDIENKLQDLIKLDDQRKSFKSEIDRINNESNTISKDIGIAFKSGKDDNREIFINKLIKKNKNIIFDVFGMNNVQPIWADQFLQKISNSYMGLNLSRGKPIKYYSSDRIVQLVGNGLLTFIDRKTYLSDFFSSKELVFYDDINDLSYKLNKFKKDKKNGKKIAKKGRDKYLKYFNSDIVSEYILSKTLKIKSKKRFIWES